MAKEKPFRLRAKPKKPTKRARYKSSVYFSEGDSLSEIAERVRNAGGDPDSAVLTVSEYYGDLEKSVEFYIEESEADFQLRLEKYEKKLKAWERWYAENREKVEKALLERKERYRREAERRIEEQKARLAAEIAKLEKQKKRYL